MFEPEIVNAEQLADEPAETPFAAPGKALSDAARRALHEAAARRSSAASALGGAEHGGPAGLEPTRFGDWERKGLAVDF